MLRKTIRYLLIEGRVDDAKKKYPEVDKRGLLDVLSQGDPSGNNKYLMWMAREMDEALRNPEGPSRNVDMIIKYVQDFHTNKQRIDKKDIMDYEEAEDVRDAVAALGVSKTKKKKDKKAVTVYEDKNFLLIHPQNEAAVCTYGKGTKWCITQKGPSGHYQDYNDHLKADAVFYFLMNKKLDISDPDYKIAFVWNGKEGGELMSIWNAEDEQYEEEDLTLNKRLKKKLFGVMSRDSVARYDLTL